jgi:hypothetical protein
MANDQVTNRGESAPVKSQLDSFLEEVKQLATGGQAGRGRLVQATGRYVSQSR